MTSTERSTLDDDDDSYYANIVLTDTNHVKPTVKNNPVIDRRLNNLIIALKNRYHKLFAAVNSKQTLFDLDKIRGYENVALDVLNNILYVDKKTANKQLFDVITTNRNIEIITSREQKESVKKYIGLEASDDFDKYVANYYKEIEFAYSKMGYTNNGIPQEDVQIHIRNKAKATNSFEDNRATSKFDIIKETRQLQIIVYNHINYFVGFLYDSAPGVEDLGGAMNRFVQHINNLIADFERQVDPAIINDLLKYDAYVFFKNKIQIIINSIKDEFVYLYTHKTIHFDAIRDTYLMEQYLNLLYDVSTVFSEQTKEETKERTNEYNDKIAFIGQFIKLYSSSKGDTSSIKHVIKDIEKIKMQIKFCHPFITYLYIDDKPVNNNNNKIILSKYLDPEYLGTKNHNLFCDTIDEQMKEIFDLDRQHHVVFGLHNAIHPYNNTCTQHVSVLYIPLHPVLYDNASNKCFWDPEMNKFMLHHIVKNMNKNNNIKGLFVKERNKAIPKFKYDLFMTKYFFRFNICFAYIKIPTVLRQSNKNITNYTVIMVCYNLLKKGIMLYDLHGSNTMNGYTEYSSLATFSEIFFILDSCPDLKFFKSSEPKYANKKDIIYILAAKNPDEKKYVKASLFVHKNNLDSSVINDVDDVENSVKNRVVAPSASNYVTPGALESYNKQSAIHVGGSQTQIQITFKDIKQFPKYITKIKNTKKEYVYKYNKQINTVSQAVFKLPNSYEFGMIMDPYFLLRQNTAPIQNTNDVQKKLSNFRSINDTILYYKLPTETALYMWEFQHKYKLIEPHFTNIYDINNKLFIEPIIIIINDKFYPNTKIKLTTLNCKYLAKYESKFEAQDTSKYTLHKNIFIDINSKEDLDKEIKNISSIDFLFMRVNVNKHQYSDAKYMKYLFYLYMLYVFVNIYNKINKGGNLCLCITPPTYMMQFKIITIIGACFEEYHITHPEVGFLENYDFYLILKHKKTDDIMAQHISHIQKELAENIPTLGDMITNNPSNEDNKTNNTNNKTSLENHLQQINDNYIKSIHLKTPALKKLYKQVKKTAHNYFSEYFLKLLQYFEERHQVMLDHPIVTDELYKKYTERGLFTCISWAKKYDMPLMPDVKLDKFTASYKHEIFKDIVSFENDIKFKFQPYVDTHTHNKQIDMQIDSTKEISFDSVPVYFLDQYVKYNRETRALDYRDLSVYRPINEKYDYYKKKLPKIIVQKYNLKDGFVTQAWLKMAEMLCKFKLIDLNANIIKSFHICELPGAFIKALQFYVSRKTGAELRWTAQSLSPEKDTRGIAFGDQANLVKHNPSNYDFGVDGTGDITNWRNILHYKNKCGNNDFVTADCGLSSENMDLSSSLNFSTYMMVFSVLAKGGNCVVKRYINIRDNQELYFLYLFYNSFDKMYFYKPRVNYQSPEIYLIGIGYHPISDTLFDSLIEFMKNYKKVGLIELSKINEKFLLQLDNCIHVLLDSFNNFIRKKIYLADNINKLTTDDIKYYEMALDTKINEWFHTFQI
jgi:hypothetical protein